METDGVLPMLNSIKSLVSAAAITVGWMQLGYGMQLGTSVAGAKLTPVDYSATVLPTILTCPLTLRPLLNPSLAADGYTYDEQAIKLWIETRGNVSPVTGQALRHSALPRNIVLQQIVSDFLEMLPSDQREKIQQDYNQLDLSAVAAIWRLDDAGKKNVIIDLHKQIEQQEQLLHEGRMRHDDLASKVASTRELIAKERNLCSQEHQRKKSFIEQARELKIKLKTAAEQHSDELKKQTNKKFAVMQQVQHLEADIKEEQLICEKMELNKKELSQRINALDEDIRQKSEQYTATLGKHKTEKQNIARQVEQIDSQLLQEEETQKRVELENTKLKSKIQKNLEVLQQCADKAQSIDKQMVEQDGRKKELEKQLAEISTQLDQEQSLLKKAQQVYEELSKKKAAANQQLNKLKDGQHNAEKPKTPDPIAEINAASSASSSNATTFSSKTDTKSEKRLANFIASLESPQSLQGMHPLFAMTHFMTWGRKRQQPMIEIDRATGGKKLNLAGRITGMPMPQDCVPRAEKIIDAIRGNNTIIEINCSGNMLGTEGAKRFAEYLSAPISVTRLLFQDNMIEDAGVGYFAKCLAKNRTLKLLDLSLNGISDRGVVELAKSLVHNDTLMGLVLDDNYIKDGGIFALTESLTFNKTLRLLSLNKNIFNQAGAKALTDYLVNHGNMVLMNLNHDKLTDATAIAVAEFLSKQPSPPLEALELTYNKITKVGLTKLAESLKCNTKLQKLSIEGNEVDDGVLQIFVNNLQKNTTLVELTYIDHEQDADIDEYYEFDYEIVEKLEKILERNRRINKDGWLEILNSKQL